MNDPATSETLEQQRSIDRHFRVRYLLLTIAFALPLLWAFVRIHNLYPAAAWTVMTGANLHRSHTYFVLRGETVAGQVVDVPAAELTDALSGRNWGLVAATVDNGPFRLRSVHPANAAILANQDIEKLPRGIRMPELLRAWGSIYNSRLPASSPERLKAIRVDAYQWLGQSYSNYDQFIESWRQEL